MKLFRSQDETAIARSAARALEPLRVFPVELSSEQESDRTRDATLPALESLIEQVPHERTRLDRSRRTQRWTAMALGVSAAAAALLAIGNGGTNNHAAKNGHAAKNDHAVKSNGRPAAQQRLTSAPTHQPAVATPQLRVTTGQILNDGKALKLGGSYAIHELGRLRTPEDGGAQVTAGGVELTLSPSSTADLAFAGPTRRVVLMRGEVTLDVPALGKASLAVVTPDAVVTVHGTRFTVSLDSTARGNTSCVRVEEGVVSVMRGSGPETLLADQHSGCERTPARQDHFKANTKRTKHTRALSRQNGLFRRAIAAQQQGQHRVARGQLTRLLTRYPKSPLAAEARRMLGILDAESHQPSPSKAATRANASQ